MVTRKSTLKDMPVKKKNSQKAPGRGHNRTGAAATKELIALGRKYFVPNYKQREMIMSHGKGARLFDIEGNDYIDFGAGIAVASLGYGDREMLRTLQEQGGKLWHTSNIFFTEPSIRLAEELVKASRFAKRAFFCNSGGEANEAAIKLARKYAADKGIPPERRRIITFHGSFHGRTLATVTATAQPKYQQGFEPLPGGFVYAPYNDIAAVEALMKDGSVCAVLTEMVQGEGGIVPMKPGFLKELRALCDRHDALLMLDQVQCGMGRTGKLFSHFWEPGVKPDVVTLAKGMGGGFPIGAMLVGEKAAEVLQFGTHGTTYGGGPLAASVARVVLSRLQQKELMAGVNARGQQLMKHLRILAGEFGMIREVRGRGLMIGAELKDAWHGKAGEISEIARKHGVIVLQAGPNVLRFVPPLVITEKEVEQGVARLRKALSAYLSQEPNLRG